MTDKEKDIRHSHAPKFKKDIPMPPVKPAPTTTCNDKKIKINSELYEIVFTDIIVQFGAGDYIEPGDRETCAEMIVEDLEKADYRKANDLMDEIAGLTGKVEALQQDNENLRRTLEEGRETVDEAKRKTAENIVDLLIQYDDGDSNTQAIELIVERCGLQDYIKENFFVLDEEDEEGEDDE